MDAFMKVMKVAKTTLLPCPFCGGGAKISRHTGGMLFKAACAGQTCIGSYIFKWYGTPEEAADAWNERTVNENDECSKTDGL